MGVRIIELDQGIIVRDGIDMRADQAREGDAHG
jgi:hypothetical protein